jgi:hypothetical protein
VKFASLKGNILSTEFQKYRFADFLRASAVAPLASIPAVLLIDLLFLFPTDRILPSHLEGFARFRAWALFLIIFSLPTAYISTAIFGALGCEIANSARVRLTIPIGAFAGVVCGVITGLLWMLFLAGGIFDLSLLFEGLGLIILLGAILCGLFVGVVYSQLLNRFVQNKSTR